MIRLSYDFHIHSCLSPCGDIDMTPSNIIGMSKIKGLDVIAITDHNSCRNVKAAIQIAKEYDILLIPGMEINTSEEVHSLCLFCNLTDALAFDEYVYSSLIKIPNRSDIFGSQLIYDESDNIVGEEPNLLINATSISFDELVSLTAQYNGITIPAHLDRSSNSLISNLGFIPPNSSFTTVEIKNVSSTDALLISHPYIQECNIIHNSDAHYLSDINEACNYIEVKNRNIVDIIHVLSSNLI